MRRFFMLISCSIILSATCLQAIADDNPSSQTPDQKKEEGDAPTIKTYLTFKRLHSGDKHQTLAVELFESKSGAKKRIEGGSMGDLFVDIETFMIPMDEPKTSTPTSTGPIQTNLKREVQVSVFRLSHAPAKDVADSLDAYFKMEMSDDQVIGAPKIVAEAASNSLIVKAKSHWQAKQVETMVVALDRRPPTFRAKIAFGKKEKDGSLTYLARPQILTVENLAGRVQVRTEQAGGGWREGYAVDVTMRSVHGK